MGGRGYWSGPPRDYEGAPMLWHPGGAAGCAYVVNWVGRATVACEDTCNTQIVQGATAINTAGG